MDLAVNVPFLIVVIIEKIKEKEGKQSVVNKLKNFIDDIENEKIIESEENQYILQLTREKLVELEKSK